MRIDPFKLERYFAEYEFSARYLLSSSDCDGLSLAEVLSWADDETRALWDGLTLGYTESSGLPTLRAEIAGLYDGVDPDDVLVAAPEELIFVAMNALLHNGDHVVCAFPAYQSLYQIAESLHCEVSFWEPDETARWRFDPDALFELIRPSTKLIVVNFPHNPTGFLASWTDFEAVLEIAARHEIPVFCDEMYRYLEYDPGDRLPAAVELYQHGCSLSGMSKSFGLAGARIGWVAARDRRLLERMAVLKDYTTICSSAPSEVLALIVLRARDQVLERHRRRISGNLAALDVFLDHYRALFSWSRPRAGTVGLVRLLPERLSVLDLCRSAVDDAGIMIAPSTLFDFGDRHFRVGFGRENLPEVLERFAAFLETKRSRG